MNEKIKLLLSILLSLLLAFTIWFGGHTAWVLYDGLNDENIKSTVGLVYTTDSFKAKKGQLPERIQNRLDKVVEQYKSSKVKYVLVSAGYSNEGDELAVSMGRYLHGKGVHSEDITLDTQGYTLKNIAFNTKKIMNEKEWNSLMVIAEYYEVVRLRLRFRKSGFKVIQAVHSPSYQFSDIQNIWMEFWRYYLGE